MERDRDRRPVFVGNLLNSCFSSWLANWICYSKMEVWKKRGWGRDRDLNMWAAHLHAVKGIVHPKIKILDWNHSGFIQNTLICVFRRLTNVLWVWNEMMTEFSFLGEPNKCISNYIYTLNANSTNISLYFTLTSYLISSNSNLIKQTMKI